MFTTNQRRGMMVVAGIIIGLLIGFGILDLLHRTSENQSSNNIDLVLFGSVGICIIIGLIFVELTRKSYEAAFSDGKNPLRGATKKLPNWYTKTRLSRSNFWFFNIILAILIFGFSWVAYVGLPESLSGYAITLSAIIFVIARYVMMIFRLNDISPETRIGLAQKGLSGIWGGLLIDFAPSSKKEESSFGEVQQFYLPEGKPNIPVFAHNLLNLVIYVAVIFGVTFLIGLIK